MPKESKYVKEFIDIVESNMVKTSSRYYTSYNAEAIVQLLSGMSKYKLGKIFSDNYWNYYPTWTNSKEVGRRDHYNGISSTVKFIRDFCPSLDKILLKKCEGAIAMACIDNIRGSDRINLSKRMIASKDSRVRRRVAAILPTKHLYKMIGDKNYSISSKAIERIGIDNCAEYLIGSGHWYESQAVMACEMSSDRLISTFESVVKDQEMYNYTKIRLARAILQKMTTEQLIYSLGMINSLSSDIESSIHLGSYREDFREYVDKRLLYANR